MLLPLGCFAALVRCCWFDALLVVVCNAQKVATGVACHCSAVRISDVSARELVARLCSYIGNADAVAPSTSFPGTRKAKLANGRMIGRRAMLHVAVVLRA